MRSVYIVAYAYGFDHKACGIDRVSRLRCDKAAELFRTYNDAFIVLAADMRHETNGCGPLANMARDYLLSLGIPMGRIILNPAGHNTLSETEAAYERIRERGGGPIIAVTSSFHALRVWLMWLCRFGIPVRIGASWHPISWGEFFGEIEKLPEGVGLSIERRFVGN